MLGQGLLVCLSVGLLVCLSVGLVVSGFVDLFVCGSGGFGVILEQTQLLIGFKIIGSPEKNSPVYGSSEKNYLYSVILPGWVSVMTTITINQLTITNHLVIFCLLTTILTIVLTSSYVVKHCTGQCVFSHCFWGLLHGYQQDPESESHNLKCILYHSSDPGYSKSMD